MPEKGRDVIQGKSLGVIESVKAVSDIHAPLSGKVARVNQELEKAPEVVNKDPYGQGWILELSLVDQKEAQNLLDSEGYSKVIAQEG